MEPPEVWRILIHIDRDGGKTSGVIGTFFPSAPGVGRGRHSWRGSSQQDEPGPIQGVNAGAMLPPLRVGERAADGFTPRQALVDGAPEAGGPAPPENPL